MFVDEEKHCLSQTKFEFKFEEVNKGVSPKTLTKSIEKLSYDPRIIASYYHYRPWLAWSRALKIIVGFGVFFIRKLHTF